MKTKLDILKQLYKHLTYYNELAPFPIYDTEYVENLNIKIMELEQNKKNNIEENEEKVTFCSHCKSLFIEVDETTGYDICGRCGSVNETESLPTIEEYLDKYKHIWE